MDVKKIFLWLFGILSMICFSTECYEIAFSVDVAYSDHLHNLIDHLMYIVVNYIGFKMVNTSK